MSKQDLKTIIQKVQHIEKNRLPIKPMANVRHASVAAIIRWKPSSNTTNNTPLSLSDFLNASWMNDSHGEAQMLFIQRASRPKDPFSGQIGFPGGKNEPEDKNPMHTVVRECKEELGLDLDSDDFVYLGSLDSRIVTRLDDDSKIMAVLYPYVYLQVTPQNLVFNLSINEVASTMWISLHYLLSNPIISFDAITAITDYAKQFWGSSVLVPAIHLKQSQEGPYLWGMTLRMTQEILGLPLSKNAIVTTIKEEDMIEHHAKQASRL
ncbi:hypothetical protein G6F56_003353 [Rhizopus delemar]|uniref:Nudix hydrolase domain-containing protein n=1 Tax=Rhizopus stolonifer TaxID=4846 RepID=A0A367JUB0_RHIST|nr:hypothetical protein G6F56_003353 [Rhizopus delemar]RCH93523.1 hypothetical protein CU098_009668 [Rhizopus stolonifer]